MTTGRIKTAIIFLLFFNFASLNAQKMPYVPCQTTLESPYGISMDIREDVLGRAVGAGAGYARIPLSWSNFCSLDGTSVYRAYDAALESLSVSPLSAVGVISPKFDRKNTAWTYPSGFYAYMKALLLRYRSQVCDWEVFKGSDDILSDGEAISAARYHSVLKVVSRMVKSANPRSRVLLGTPYNLKTSFLDSLSACGSQDYFDIMTFSAYSNPEEIPSLVMKIRRSMKKNGWSKPVWLTNASCGYKPPVGVPFDFWQKDVPAALKSAGINTRKTTVTVVDGALNRFETVKFLSTVFGAVEYVAASDLAKLDAKSHRVLVPGRNVPQSDIARYVGDGGIVIVGSPRWPEAIHAAVAPGAGRYLAGSNLREGEKMEVLEQKSGKVLSAFYRLSSGGGAIVLAGKGPEEYFDREAEQAERVARIHILAFASGVEKVFWNGIRSEENDPSLNRDYAGLCHSDLSEKPAYAAYSTLVSMLPGGSSRPVLECSGKVFLASWTGADGQKVYAVWSTGNAGADCIRIDGRPVLYDHLGGRVKTLSGIGPGVVYITSADKVELVNI